MTLTFQRLLRELRIALLLALIANVILISASTFAFAEEEHTKKQCLFCGETEPVK